MQEYELLKFHIYYCLRWFPNCLKIEKCEIRIFEEFMIIKLINHFFKKFFECVCMLCIIFSVIIIVLF